MNTTLDKLDDLNRMITEGKIIEALEKHYHESVEMQENDAMPTIGKNRNIEREKEFLGNITEFRGASVKSFSAVHDNLTVAVWHFDYTHKEWGIRNYQQLSVQHWQDGKIIKEQFIYNN